jgi:hypothetical protein
MNILETLIEVKLKEQDDFLKIRETLSRVGIAAKKERKLYQSCHILHKQGKYYIVHFKELFALDGKPTNFSDEDKGRRNTVVALLDEWGLVTIVNPSSIESPRATLNNIKILPYGQKEEWELCAKYNIGRK